METTINLNGKEFKVSYQYKGETSTAFGGGKNDGWRNKFKVTIKAESGKTSFNFHGSINDYNIGKTELSESDLKRAVSCFISDAISGEMSFEDFCSEFGYDTDSRSTHKIWKACIKSAEKIKVLEIEDLYETVNELEN